MRLHRRLPTIVVGTVAVAYIGGLALVVHHLGWTHVDYGTFAATGVALATLLLAAMTFRLARATQAMAGDARDQIAAAHAQTAAIVSTMEASVRPWLAPTAGAPAVSIVGDDVLIKVPFRNAGAGLALLEPHSISLITDDKDPLPNDALDASASQAIVPVGEEVVIEFRAQLSKLPSPYDEAERWISATHQRRFSVQILYVDMNGHQQTCLQAYVQSATGGAWRLQRIGYVRGSDNWISELEKPR